MWVFQVLADSKLGLVLQLFLSKRVTLTLMLLIWQHLAQGQ